MLQLLHEQRLECPPDLAERVTLAGGVNPYDEPNFRVTWMENETMRAGGFWDNPDLSGVENYRGYRDVLADGGGAYWAIREWKPAEFWGTPAAWYAENFDEQSEMQTLGGYPYSGRYVTVFPLVTSNGETVALSNEVVEVIIPIIVWAKQINDLQKRAVIAEHKARKEASRVAKIEDSLRNAYPALGEIRSAAGLACLSVVQKKVEQIERHWATGIDFVKQRGRGLSVN